MSKQTWNSDDAQARIEMRLSEVGDVSIKDYVRDTDLCGLARNVAYRVDGVHVYIDILNFREMLGVTNTDGITSHRRTLRFLNLHFRAVARILGDVDAIRVDFHNQRLHAVITKPYDNEAKRIHRAIALAQLIIDVLQQTGEGGDDPLPAAVLRVGIDSGVALAVNNGRPGHREPLFLGQPANQAAKRAGNQSAPGIFATNSLRAVIGAPAVADEDLSAVSAAQILVSQEKAALEVSATSVVKAWKEDLAKHPISRFEFSGHTPPFRDLDLQGLAAGNSRRQEAVSLYADIDGFTAYVAKNLNDDEDAKNVVRVLHVLRSELDHVLVKDFAGLKVRFIGDCIHGLLVEGTAQTTDAKVTIETAALCAGAMRSSFALAQEILEDGGIPCGLGLAIGFDYGPLAISRLGIKGELIPCAIGRSVLKSESEQRRCTGTQTAFGEAAKGVGPEWLTTWFGDGRRLTGITYQAVVKRLDDSKKAKTESLLRPASVAATASAFAFPTKPATPTKPAGFA